MTQESSTVFLHKKLSSHQTFLQREPKIHKFFIRILFWGQNWCSGITPVKAQWTMLGAEVQTLVILVEGKHPIHCSIVLASVFISFNSAKNFLIGFKCLSISSSCKY